MRDGFIKVAAGTPKIRVADCRYNAEQIFTLMREADKQGVKVLALPELCLTGYTCGDLFLQDTLLRGAEEGLKTILEATRNLDMVAAVGLPVRANNKLYNCAAVIHKGKILGLVPKTTLLHCTSLTGYSGGGKKMIAQYEAERTDPALDAPRPYGLALHHKHLPEMAAITGLTTPPTFVPVVADYYAGMETMIPLDLPALGLTAQQVADALADYYAGQKMISVHPLNEGTDGGFLAANKLAGLDRLEIFCLANPDGTQMELISLFDNLGKGSSGAAVQCMNLMLGQDETAGLAL